MSSARGNARASGAGVWSLITRPGDTATRADDDMLEKMAARFAFLVSPVLADFLLSDAARQIGRALVDADALARDRLAARFRLVQQRRWAEFLVRSPVETVFLKGFANAHSFYPDPLLRMQGDLDILVRENDLARLIGLLAAEGFRFRTSRVNAWGMISDASFMPFVSADGACDIDIHIRPDCFPAHRSLSTDRVFAAARTADAGGFPIRIPSVDHAFALCITNAAKDKFDAISIRKVIDAIVMLRGESLPDWDAIAALARDGGFAVPARAFLALLDALGAAPRDLPPDLAAPLKGLRRGAFEEVVADWRVLFPDELPLTTLFWREATLAAEPGVALHNGVRRLCGVFRRRSGIPAGAPVEVELDPTVADGAAAG
jgi:hypothetical protein